MSGSREVMNFFKVSKDSRLDSSNRMTRPSTSLKGGDVFVGLPKRLAQRGQVPQEAVHLLLGRVHLLQRQLDQLLGRRRVGRLPGEDGQDRLGDTL